MQDSQQMRESFGRLSVLRKQMADACEEKGPALSLSTVRTKNPLFVKTIPFKDFYLSFLSAELKSLQRAIIRYIFGILSVNAFCTKLQSHFKVSSAREVTHAVRNSLCRICQCGLLAFKCKICNWLIAQTPLISRDSDKDAAAEGTTQTSFNLSAWYELGKKAQVLLFIQTTNTNSNTQ